ncbi:uncharacterized protein LOC132803959 [Ziziphus jujuba]|uniref:Uncharacterized protein LOC132803959 n=1 Tax=Ziziphus jujuba TaxID=326968 RepID=A0ABM4AAQ2_ZIZJJ|nr:uncharacterized protein LOC132803959 [Ziziphus jujuba]
MEDNSSLYFLHHADHPSLQLVSHELTGPNYNSWHHSMEMALRAKNKLSFVDGSIPKPNPTDLLASVRDHCNSMVHSWLLNAVSKDIADILLYQESAYAVWTDLCDKFHQSNAPRIFQINQQLHALLQGSIDINSYYTRVKVLWDELRHYQPTPTCHCGGIRGWALYQVQEYVLQFPMGLNESFSAVRAQILMLDPLPPIAKVFNLVIQEERQRTIGSIPPNPTESMAFLAATNVVTSSGPKQNRPTCTHCGLQGHTVDKCYKLHGYPPGYKLPTRCPSHASSLQLKSQGGNQRSILIQPKVENTMRTSGTPSTSPSTPLSNSNSTQQSGQMSPIQLNHEQIQQMISYLSLQLPASSTPTSVEN